MKKCIDCGYISKNPGQYTCPKCSAKLEIIDNQAAAFQSDACDQCGNHRSRNVTINDKKQNLCFYCYQKIRSKDFFSAPQTNMVTVAEKYERLALVKINEANYLRDNDMLGKATRLYQLSNDLRLGINSDLSSLMQSLANELL